jgi:uncharacterized protein
MLRYNREGGFMMKELILVMAKALVDKPDEVEIKEIEGDVTTILELKVAKDDLGKVIGKQGKTAHAMRSILNATATKLKKRAVLEIIE